MIEAEIADLKQELNYLLDKGIEIRDVYDLSVRLDKLILQYYMQQRKMKEYV